MQRAMQNHAAVFRTAETLEEGRLELDTSYLCSWTELFLHLNMACIFDVLHGSEMLQS
jgi:hypothetical protein